MLRDKFVIGERLGIGATAEVFSAVVKSTGERRALKVFTPLVLSDPDTVKRIEAEVAALQLLSHPNIVKLFGAHSAGTEELALELEFVDGTDLRQWRKNYSLTLHEPVLWILCQVARGIGCAHEYGILHRDLKPENVLISRKGDVKLTDFGLARQLDAVTMTKSGLLAGSIGYMAPEMLDGERCTPLSDIFSFGAVAYELLTGVNPFAGPNPQSMMKKMLHGQYRPLGELMPGIPAAIEALVISCLSLDPSKRPASIWHVEAELMNALPNPMRKHCRALVSVEERGRTLEAAFLDKRRELETRREALLNAPRTQQILLAREWSYALPDSPAPAEILASLQEEPKRPMWQRAAAALLLLLFLGSGTWLLWLARTPAPTPAPAPVVQAPPPPPVVDRVIVKAAAPAKPPAVTGWIRVEADDDVKLYLDGEEIPKRLWSRIPADPGRRRLKLVKEGFLPIENVIGVTAGKVAVVRAKGGN